MRHFESSMDECGMERRMRHFESSMDECGMERRMRHLERLVAHAITGPDVVMSREAGLSPLPRQVAGISMDAWSETDEEEKTDDMKAEEVQ